MKPLEERNLAAAGAEFTAALARNARDTTALYYMGRIVMAEERSGEAVDWFEKAVKVDDNSSEYHLWLANALGQEAQRASKLRQPFLAVRVKGEFECAVQLDPRGVVARRGLMDFYMIARRHGGSKEMLDRLLAANQATCARTTRYVVRPPFRASSSSAGNSRSSSGWRGRPRTPRRPPGPARTIGSA